VTVSVTPELVERVHNIALRAGRAIMPIYQSDFAVRAKADDSPVTAADQAAEELILAAIGDELKSPYPVVAEESVAAGRIPDVAGRPFWLVDPLDGTKEFIKRNGEFTVNIALVDGGRPVLGVVHAPAIGATYWASPLGAFAETDGGPPRPIAARPAPADGLVVVASRSHRGPEMDDFLKGFRVASETNAGSSLKFCLVACGKADLYPRLGRTMEWDTAAGQAVVQFAGGRVTTRDGAGLAYGKPGFENPHFIVWGRGGDGA
jgi:3'(2'), 5'-bisphosphate nucleotidase